MPNLTPIVLDHTNTLREFEFVSSWNGEEVLFMVGTTGKLCVRNLSTLTPETQEFLGRVIALAEKIEGSPAHDRLIKHLQTEITDRESSLTTISTRASTGISSRSENPYDRYYVSSSMRLPALFSRVVPSINIFMMLLSALLLIPDVSTNSIGLFIAITISSLAFIVQFFSDFFQRHLGARFSSMLQDGFSVVSLSITSFSSIRTLLSLFLGRSLEVGSVSDPEADFIGKIVVFILASLGAAAAWFSPPISVMGPRVQAMAIQLEEAFLSLPTIRSVSRREAIVNNFSRADIPFAYRFFCPTRQGRTTDFRPDARVIEPPTLTVALTRIGGAFVRSTQLATSLGMNQNIFSFVLIPLSIFGLLHSFVSREHHIVAGSRILRIPALSSYAPVSATRFKFFSELSSVSSNSMINPTIAFFFVFKKLLDFARGSSSFLSFYSLALLALAVVVNTFSLILDLSSRRLGIDRFDGWTPSQLRRIITEAETASIRGNLGEYLQTVIMGAHHSIALPEGVDAAVSELGSTARAGRIGTIARDHSSMRALMP